ncbi:hypothetical protein [Azospirillum sp. TSH100]|uniref:hypothetical protein n=1 Tax=Azospirillum sp. TSH100 TaxID=652764 RepID=UPI000D64EC59|nr:hypothetical protein [Azospirillum sp. TSH100]
MRLAALSTHVPAARIDAEAVVRAAGGSPAEARVFRRLFGIDGVAAMPADEGASEQFGRVIAGLAARHRGEPPDTLVHVRGLPMPFPEEEAPVPELVRRHAFLAGVVRQYEIDQTNCSGVFWALDLARTLLDAGMSRSVAVLAGDCHAGLPLGDRYVAGCTLMGDAFCGLVLDRGPGGLRFGNVVLRTHPEFAFGRAGSVAQIGTFFAAHTRIVREALDAAGFAWKGRSPLLPHNVNSLAWLRFCRETGVAPERVDLGLLPDIGHCYTSDPLLLLGSRLDAAAPDVTPDADGIMLLSVGMGGFVGACRLSREAVQSAGPWIPQSVERAASCPPFPRF